METGFDHSKTPGRTGQLYEVLVFLFLVIPSMILSFFAIEEEKLSFALISSATILRDLSLVTLVFFFIWRNREPFISIGWTTRNLRKEFLLGLVLFAPFTVGIGFIETLLRSAGLYAPKTPIPSFLSINGTADIILASIMTVVVAFSEETIFRGYLILRFREVTASPAAAVLISAFIFSLGHGYEGSAGVVTVGVTGIVLAIIYLWRGSLIAPMIMHFLQDFIGIVVSR